MMSLDLSLSLSSPGGAQARLVRMDLFKMQRVTGQTDSTELLGK